MAIGSETARDPQEIFADSPYVGLSYYTEAVADVFFGRESERTLIIGNLRAARLTVLYAPSGVGKSSLLRAGVAARLRELATRSMAERESARFIPVVFASWRDEPVNELIEALEAAIAPFASDSDIALPRDRLDKAIDAAAQATGATPVVILDQFEEYFLYGAAEAETVNFADELARCINRRELPASFLIAVREDAYAGVGDLLRGKVANPYANTFNLEYLDREAAREAISRPVEHFNAVHPDEEPMEIEPALVEAVLDQVRAGQVAFEHEGRGTIAAPDGAGPAHERVETPYLQLVMTVLWERERAAGSHRLRKATLDELGGAQAIVRSHLDDAMDRLDEDERETAVEVFNHLVTPSGTKIVHTITDLAEYGGRDVSQVQALVDRLSSGDQRILRPVPPAPGETSPRVEIFHDVLAPAILAWRAGQTSARLEQERQEAEDRANRERRRARTFRALAGIAFALLVVAVVAVILARTETNRAHHAERLALSRQLAGQAAADLQGGALSRGVLLSVQASRYSNNAESRLALFRSLQATEPMVAYLGGHIGDVTSVAYSPIGRLVASGSSDGTVMIQNLATGRIVRVLHSGATVQGIAFNPGGSLLASGDEAGKLILWNVASGRRVWVSRPSNSINGVAVNSAGTVVAAGNNNGTVTLSDTATGRTLRTLPGHVAVFAVAFGPDGHTLASGTGRDVILWNAATGAVERTLRGHTAVVNGVAFAPDGRTLASASGDHTVILWNPATGQRERTLRGHTSFVNAVAFSPDGSMLASAGADHNVILWNATSGRRLQTLRGHSANVEAVAFSPSGYTLASGADDARVIVWRARPTLDERVLYPGSVALSVAYSPNGRLLASAQANGTAALWDATTGQLIHVLRGPTQPVLSVAFSPDGRTLAGGSADNNVYLWDTATGARERTLRGHTGLVYSVAFSPDGRTLASGSADQNVILWNASTGARERTLTGNTDFVYGVAFSPDSKTVASASNDQEVMLWDAASGRLERTLTGHTGAVESVAFSPDGGTLASASSDGTVILSSPVTGKELGSPLQAQDGSLLTVAFSHNGRMLATGDSNQNVILWDLGSRLALPLYGDTGQVLGLAFAPGGSTLASASADQTVRVRGPLPPKIPLEAVYARLCSVVKRNLSAREWNEFLSGEPYQKTCPAWPSGS